MRVLVTRPARQAQSWTEALRAALPGGIDVVALPLIEVAAPSQTEPVEQAWRQLADARLAVFVSPSAAQWFFALRPAELPVAWPTATRAAAPGPGTGDMLTALGVPPAAVLTPAADAAQFDSETLWARLDGLAPDWQGARVLMICGGEDARARGRPWLTQQLQARGAQVQTVVSYQRRAPQLDATQQAQAEQALRAPAAHAWLFSSSEAIGHLLELQRRHGWPAPGAAAIAITTHPRIAEAAQAAGFGRVVRTRPALPDVVASLHELLAEASGAAPA